MGPLIKVSPLSINSKECRSERTHLHFHLLCRSFCFKFQDEGFLLCSGSHGGVADLQFAGLESGNCPSVGLHPHPCLDSFKDGKPPTPPCCIKFKQQLHRAFAITSRGILNLRSTSTPLMGGWWLRSAIYPSPNVRLRPASMGWDPSRQLLLLSYF